MGVRMKKLRIGVIGTGRIGRLHVENLTKFVSRAEVVALADIYIDQAREWASEYGITNLYSDYRELIARDDVDAVIVATSTDTHAEVSIAAAKAKKAIFCEKPIDSDIDRIHEVIAAVKENGVPFQTGFNRRFDHNFRGVRKLVEDGTLGEPHIVRVSSRDPAPPPISYVKVSGGLFSDMMIHDFDMVRYLAGSDVVEVTAHGAVLVDPAIGEAGDVDTAVVVLKMKNGALCTIDNSRQAVYGYDQRVEVFGSKGMAYALNDKPTTVEVFTEDAPRTDKIPHFFLDRYTGAFVDQFEAFVAMVLDGAPNPVDEIDGLRAVEIAKAAQQSLEEGRTVTLEV